MSNYFKSLKVLTGKNFWEIYKHYFEEFDNPRIVRRFKNWNPIKNNTCLFEDEGVYYLIMYKGDNILGDIEIKEFGVLI